MFTLYGLADELRMPIVVRNEEQGTSRGACCATHKPYAQTDNELRTQIEDRPDRDLFHLPRLFAGGYLRCGFALAHISLLLCRLRRLG